MFMPPLSLACYHVLRPILAKKKRFNGKKKPNNITRGEEKRISKIRKTIRTEWQKQWYIGPQNSKRTPKKENGPKRALKKEAVSPWES